MPGENEGKIIEEGNQIKINIDNNCEIKIQQNSVLLNENGQIYSKNINLDSKLNPTIILNFRNEIHNIKLILENINNIEDFLKIKNNIDKISKNFLVKIKKLSINELVFENIQVIDDFKIHIIYESQGSNVIKKLGFNNIKSNDFIIISDKGNNLTEIVFNNMYVENDLIIEQIYLTTTAGLRPAVFFADNIKINNQLIFKEIKPKQNNDSTPLIYISPNVQARLLKIDKETDLRGFIILSSDISCVSFSSFLLPVTSKTGHLKLYTFDYISSLYKNIKQNFLNKNINFQGLKIQGKELFDFIKDIQERMKTEEECYRIKSIFHNIRRCLEYKGLHQISGDFYVMERNMYIKCLLKRLSRLLSISKFLSLIATLIEISVNLIYMIISNFGENIAVAIVNFIIIILILGYYLSIKANIDIYLSILLTIYNMTWMFSIQDISNLIIQHSDSTMQTLKNGAQTNISILPLDIYNILVLQRFISLILVPNVVFTIKRRIEKKLIIRPSSMPKISKEE